MRTGDTQIVYVETGDPDNVAWRSDNEFVATVERGRISGLRIGQTRITANNASVSVTVRGRSDLYDEPMEDLSWNMTREQVDKNYINNLTYSTSTMTVGRTGYDDDYWLVSYRQIK